MQCNSSASVGLPQQQQQHQQQQHVDWRMVVWQQEVCLLSAVTFCREIAVTETRKSTQMHVEVTKNGSPDNKMLDEQ